MSLEVNCPQCKQEYSKDNPPKKLVNCVHTLCLKCLKEQILCPVDRVRIQLRRFTIDAFKTNEEILALLEKGKQSPKQVEPPRSARTKKSESNYVSTSNHKKSKSSVPKPIQEVEPKKQVKITAFQQKYDPEPITPEPSVVAQKTLKSPKMERKSSLSPKKQIVNFDTCLLHSKKADLICMEDKCLICANCGLFGQHKLHTLIPFDNFLTQYSLLTEQCFKNYEQLQRRQDKLNIELIQERVDQLLADKKNKQIKQIKVYIRQLNQLVKNVEKELMSNLETTVSFKKNKIIQSFSFSELVQKRNDFMGKVENMTEGLESIFSLENIEKYVPYIDPNDAHSYVLEEGEFLVREIDNYSKTVNQRFEEDIEEFSFKFQLPSKEVLTSPTSIQSTDQKQINDAIARHKKEQELKVNNSLKNGTPSRSKSCRDTTVLFSRSGQKPKEEQPPKNSQDNTLLLGLDSCLQSPKKQANNFSPIQQYSNACNIQFSNNLSNGSQFFFKGPDILSPNFVSLNTNKKGRPPVNKTLNSGKMTKHVRMQSNQNDLSQSMVRHKSKTKSNNNSNNLTQRELLHVLNQKSDNKKKKKLDLPQKYSKIYDQLHKDRLQICDLGGAFLGDATILSISELFSQSRGKLKQVKLMNNKISDDIFSQLIYRCRLITSINLSYNMLTERCLDWLEMEAGHLGELKTITLSNNKIVLRNNRERIEELKKKGIIVTL